MSICSSNMLITMLSKHTLLLIIISYLLLLIIPTSGDAALLFAHRRNNQQHQHPRPYLLPGGNSSRQCNLFAGEWVRDDSYSPSLYRASECAVVDPQFDCQHYGRPDSDYLRYRWAPASCELPRFNAGEFLDRMRGKTVLFVGDSIGKNQWESLACMLSAGLPTSSSPPQITRGYPLSTVKFLEYEVTISFYKAPYLVDLQVIQGKRVLRLDEISSNGNSWRDADVLSFNTGHWWTHTGATEGWDYMELNGKWFEDMDRLTAMENALRTWSHWLEYNVDTSKTRVFFLSISPTHDNPTEWGSGAAMTITTTARKNCYGQTEPVMGEALPADGVYPSVWADQLKAVRSVLGQMASPPFLLDITALSAMRKDAHPSIYSGDLTPGQRANPYRSSDCSHWCLPGLPDTWNQLFYTALLY